MQFRWSYLFLFLVVVLSAGCSGSKLNPVTVTPDESVLSETGDLRALAVDQSNPDNYWAIPLILDGKTWASNFNENGTLHRAIGLGIDSPDPLEFIAEHRDVFQVDPRDLVVLLDEFHSGIHYLIYLQTFKGVVVDKSRVDFRYSRNNKLVMIGSDVFPLINVDTKPSLSEYSAVQIMMNDNEEEKPAQPDKTQLVIYPIPETGTLAWRIDAGNWRYYIDATSGSILERIQHRWNAGGTFDAHVETSVKMLSPYDPEISVGGEHFKIEYRSAKDYPFIYYNYGYTDFNGNSSFICSHETAWADCGFRSDYARVWYDYFQESKIQDWVYDKQPVNYIFNDTNSLLSERMAFYYMNKGRDYVKNIDNEFMGLDQQHFADVNQSPECNAYADSYGIEMHAAQPGVCADSAHVPDVILHEYGHVFTFNQYTIECPSDVHEGCSDYFGCTVTDQPYVGRDFWGPGTKIRWNEAPIQWPAPSCGTEPHCLGQLLSTSLWEVRKLLGRQYSDYLFMFARYGNPTTTPDFPPEMIILDDDNDNPLDGSANYSALKEAFYVKHSVPFPSAPDLPTSGISIDLWPVKPPVRLTAATGGNVFYKLRLTNLDASTPHTFQIWAAVEIPPSGFYGPILPPSVTRCAPMRLTLSGGQTFEVTLKQAIPANLPVGTYKYHVRAGAYVNHINDILADDAWFDIVLE